MITKKPKVVAMCCDGLYQRYFINKLASEYELVGVVLHSYRNDKGSLVSRAKRYLDPVRLVRYLQARVLMGQYNAAARPVVKKLFYLNGKPPEIDRNVPCIAVTDVNEPACCDFVEKLAPDVICVNGTNLLRQPLLKLVPRVPYGIINLHTGLSPYSRGGNCNLFMLLEGHPELVGLTIHHIDEGTDSGDIMISARPDMGPEDNYEIIDAKTFRLGFDLMIVAIRQLMEGRAARVKQWKKGKLFLRRTGYVYEPYLRVRVNRLLKKGLLRNYLLTRDPIDKNIVLVGEQN